MMDEELIRAHRERALSPDKPVVRGTAQNPDVFFQAREAISPYYEACPGHVEQAMEKFAEVTGRATCPTSTSATPKRNASSSSWARAPKRYTRWWTG